jgi:eukaryotic-like serine/threonine-protein kinase
VVRGGSSNEGSGTESSTGGSSSTLRRSAGAVEHLGDLRRAKPALLFACIVWPLFVFIDLAHVHAGGEGDLTSLLVLRALPMPWFSIAVWRVQRRPPISERELWILVYGAIYALMVVLALDCAVTGGFRSLYAEANVAVLAATTAVPRPYPKHLPRMIVAALIYPTIMVAGALFWPPMQGQLTDLGALHHLGAHLAMVITTTAIVVLASHRLWSLRREVFETRSIGRYELRRRIGKGGMGEVWAAWHRGIEREVALKILRLSEDDHESARERFEREVRLSSGLSHPHTVRVFDYGTTEDGLLYYAMELLEGASLAEVVRRDGPLPPERAVHLVSQAARALAEAHDRGIVHRDVKPENLFVTAAGGESDYVKVLDFGIARLSNDGATHLTQTGLVAGTPASMSPEVIRGAVATPASDVYGLGVVLYFALTGAPPFTTQTAATTLLAHLEDPVVPPSVRSPHEVPSDVDALVLRCLEKRPEGRFADAHALAAALAECSVAGRWIPPPTSEATSPAPAEPAPARHDADTRVTARTG